jgi:hypothetical protein
MKDYSKEAIEILSETFKELYPKSPWESNDKQFIEYLDLLGCGPSMINMVFSTHTDDKDLPFNLIQNNIKQNLKTYLQHKPYVGKSNDKKLY